MDSYIEIIERLRVICLNRATGKTADFVPFVSPEKELIIQKNTQSENNEYILLRDKLLDDLSLNNGIPVFLKVCKTMPDFWVYIKSRFKSYDERRKFLNVEFDKAINEFNQSKDHLDSLLSVDDTLSLTKNVQEENSEIDFSILDKDLDTLKLWLKSFLDLGNKNRLASFWNVVIYGRIVTFHLRKLFSNSEEFRQWYAPYMDFMANDELMKFFKEKRNYLEKEGLIFPDGASTYIRNLKLPEDLKKLGTKPPGAVSFFIGDQSAGSGWIVIGPDGKQYKQYVKLPKEIGDSGLILKGIPKSHKGKIIEHPTLEKVSELYVDYLVELVNSAKYRFSAK